MLLIGVAMYLLGIISWVLSNSAYIESLISSYGYLAIFGLMVLEQASLPVPSEVILPLSGLFAEKGYLSFPLAYIAGLLGAVAGLSIDYAAGYLIGKDIIYKHLRWFRVKKETLDNFDTWFTRNAVAAVFISRLIPEVRGLMSFPAGFARMPLKRFFGYSLAGAAIWDLVLMLFGFYLLSAGSAVIIMASVGVFGVALYLIYAMFMRHARRH